MKSTMKRWMSLLLAALMCLSLLPVGALADEEAADVTAEEIVTETAAEELAGEPAKAEPEPAEAEESTETEAPSEEEIPTEPEEPTEMEAPTETAEPAEPEEPVETEEAAEIEESVELEDVSAEAMGAYANDWSQWSQGGSSYSAMKSGGCRLVAQCKLLAEAGVVSASSFTPDDYLKWVAANGYINSTSAVGETTTTGSGMIAYAKAKGVTITRIATKSLSGSNSEKKATIQSYLNQGYYVILNSTSPAHQTYIMQSKSKSAGTPWISDSSSNYASVSTSSGIYAYSGNYGNHGWEATFTTAYVYSVGKTSGSTTTISGIGVSNITETTARIDATCSYTGSRPSSVALCLGETMATMYVWKEDDTSGGSKNPFDIWYDLSGLKKGTTYYYTMYYIVNGEKKETGTYSFTTIGATTTYTVKYNANGGNGTMADTKVTYGVETPLRKNTFTRTGYTFGGWYTYRASDGKYLYWNPNKTSEHGWYKRGSQPSGWTYEVYENGCKVAWTSSVNKDTVTMYAIWKANTYTVKYNANGGTGSMADTTVHYGTDTKLRTNTFTRTGYTFAGWYAYRASDGKYLYCNPNDTSKNGWYKSGSQPSGWTYDVYPDGQAVARGSTVDKDTLTYYAIWEPVTLTIKYDANGGTGAPAPQTKTYLEALTLSSTKPTRTGYTFLGWSTSKTAAKASYLPGKTYTSIGSTTLYAVWESNAKTPQLVVSSAKAPAGKDVAVPVSLKDNPGINTFTIKIDYDSTKLTLSSVTPASALGGSFLYTESTHTVAWQAGSDTTYNGVAFTLNFTTLSGFQSGTAAVSLSYTEGNICNYNEEDVDFGVVAGAVSAASYLPGDINGDGAVNNKDLNRLMKYLADNATEVVSAALDVNGDGSVNNKDLNRLMKYLADSTVEIH